MRSLALASVLFAYVSAGCAVIAAKSPDPARRRDEPPSCNVGKGGVVVDGLMATTMGIATLAAASDGEGEVAAITGLIAAMYGISAGVGSSSANKCRAAMDDFVALRENEKAEAAFARGSVAGMPIAPPEYEDKPAAPVHPHLQAHQPQPQPQPEPQPQAQPQPQPQPQPKPQPQPQPKPQPKAQPDAGGGDEGEWSEFWKEVP